ncbi:MAG TPA: hypothetical protein VKA60_00640 [Blastocatellia bacterium]|nr:hypothetical protein [Blastocatellia bacterium]
MKRSFLAVAIFTMMTAVAINAQNSDAGGKQLQGAWRITVIPEEGGPPAFPVLFSFSKDGGVIETDQGPAAPDQPPSTFSAGLGEWQKVGKRTYIITYNQLQYDQAMNLIGTFRGRITAEVNPEMNSLTGELIVEFFDTSDTLLFTGGGMVQGYRLPVLGAH